MKEMCGWVGFGLKDSNLVGLKNFFSDFVQIFLLRFAKVGGREVSFLQNFDA